MKRSHQVTAPLLAATALAISGCHHQEMQRCVDENNKVVDQSFCKNLPAPQQNMGGGYRGGAGGMGFFPYHYYYGGLGGYALGSIVSGGSNAPIAGRTYSTTPRTGGFFSGSSRGGFGSSHGGGEGGHGGGGGE